MIDNLVIFDEERLWNQINYLKNNFPNTNNYKGIFERIMKVEENDR